MSLSFLHGVYGPSIKVKRPMTHAPSNSGDYKRRKAITTAEWAEIRGIVKCVDKFNKAIK